MTAKSKSIISFVEVVPFPAIFYKRTGEYKWASNAAKARGMKVRWDSKDKRWVCSGLWKPTPPAKKKVSFKQEVEELTKTITRTRKIARKMGWNVDESDARDYAEKLIKTTPLDWRPSQLDIAMVGSLGKILSR